MLHVSLDCPFLIVAAVFSNIYLMYCSLSDQYSVCILIWQVFYKRQKLLTRHMGSSPDLGGVVLLIFLVFCVVLFVLVVLVLCLVCPMLPVFLDFPFLIAPSVLSNVYNTSMRIIQRNFPSFSIEVYV